MKVQDLVLTSCRKGVVLERSILPACDGLVRFRQQLSGTGKPTIVTHSASIVSIVQVMRGSLSFSLPLGAKVAPERFLLVVPPRTVLPMNFVEAMVETDGVAGVFSFISGVSGVFHCPTGNVRWDHSSIKQAIQMPPIISLNPDLGASSPVIRARQLMHELLAFPAPVRMAAARIGMSAEGLTRAFVRAYGISPKTYCHRARLFQAVLSLLSGVSILDAALESGFHDLTRFYVQFRRRVGST